MVIKDDRYSLRNSLRLFIRLLREEPDSSYYKKRLEDNIYKLLHIANITPYETGSFKSKKIREGLGICFDIEFLLGEALYFEDLKNYKELTYNFEDIRNIFFGWYKNDQENK